MLITIFAPIQKKFSSYLKYHEVRTDNLVFRLHCILTAAILVMASVILTTDQLVGKPIECISDKIKDDKWHKAIETYCWISSTFTMQDFANRDSIWKANDSKRQEFLAEYYKDNMGLRVPYQGIRNEYEYDGAKKYHQYYQWVCFVLFAQAILCYLPKAAWDVVEGGRLEKLATGFKMCGSEEREKKSDTIICYLLRYQKEHKCYALVYWLCELLCLLNLVLQMCLMRAFLHADFYSISHAALTRTDAPQHDRFDPLVYIFPRISKCTFHYYGPSGGIVNLDSLCVLPQNAMNEKVYVFLWFWYIALAVLLGLVVLFRLAILFVPGLRPSLLALRSRALALQTARDASDILDFGDWWMLYILAKNLNPKVHRGLVSDFLKRSQKLSLLHN